VKTDFEWKGPEPIKPMPLPIYQLVGSEEELRALLLPREKRRELVEGDWSVQVEDANPT
jgi:hypothetical protein